MKIFFRIMSFGALSYSDAYSLLYCFPVHILSEEWYDLLDVNAGLESISL